MRGSVGGGGEGQGRVTHMAEGARSFSPCRVCRALEEMVITPVNELGLDACQLKGADGPTRNYTERESK